MGRKRCRFQAISVALIVIGVVVLSASYQPMLAAPGSACTRIGGTLIVADQEAPHLNPTLIQGPFIPANNVYDRLLSVDYGMQVSPGLAERWSVSNDSLTYTFQLARNVKWTDGVPFTSDDIKFTYEGIVQQSLPGKPYFEDVERIDTPNANTLVIRLKKPNAAFLPLLAMTGTWFNQILPRHLYEGTDWRTNPHNMQPIGTGPFIFERWEKGSYVSFVANKDYFRGRPCLDRVVVRWVSDPKAAQEAFKAGELHYLPENQTPPIRELIEMAKDPRWRVITVPFWYYYGIYFNVRRAPFNDERVRRAFAYAIDQEEQNQKALLGKGVVEKSPGLDYLPGNWVNTKATFPAFNPQQAEKLFDEAGLSRKADGTRLSVRYLTFPGSQFEAMADILKTQVAKVGINLIIEQVEYPGTFFDRARNANFDAMLYFVRYGPDPGVYNEHFGTGAPRNFMGYSNPSLDRILDEGLRVVDHDKRLKIYSEAQSLLVKDLPFVHMCPSPYFFLASNRFRHFASEKETWGRAGPWHGAFRLVEQSQ